MAFFDFFKKITKSKINVVEELPNYYSKKIMFSPDGIYFMNLTTCKVGDYVSLWTKPEVENVFIYSSTSLNGSGKIGYVPFRYKRLIRNHLLSMNHYSMSGPCTNNYDATIIDISNHSCKIEVLLYSHEQHKKRIDDLLLKEKNDLDEKLSAKYLMKKPIELSFTLINSDEKHFNDLSLKVFDKEHYLKDPYILQIQLLNNNKVIGELNRSERDKVLRIIKSKYNNQKLKLSKRSKWKNIITVLIEPE